MDSRTDVLVVGAGPVGLTAALELRRRGVNCRVVDRLPAALPYAKAVGIQPRTLEIWAAAGLLRDALDAAVELRGQISFVNGQEAGRLPLHVPPDIPYGFVALPQYEVERILTGRLVDLGVAVERGVALASFAQDDDEVTARLEGPAGPEPVRARYLVGCDGAHSLVRRGLGLAFQGSAFPEQYMLGDVEVDWSMPPGWAIRSMRVSKGTIDDLLVCIPLPGRRRYRMSMLVPPELATPVGRRDDVRHGLETDRPAPTLADIQAVVDRLAPEPTVASSLRWSSVFRISHRLVERYSVGRVFLAGDAAHVHPPTGAQGMNTGIQDAWNLGWKLALAVQGEAGPELLRSYHAERRPVGQEVVERTVRHAREGFDEDADDPSQPIRREAQLLVGYRNSSWVAEDRAPGNWDALPRPRPGDRAPDAGGLVRAAVTHPVRLFELISGPRHTLLLYVEDAARLPALEEVAHAARQRAHGRLDAYAVAAAEVVGGALEAGPGAPGGSGAPGAALAEAASAAGTLPVVADVEGEFRAAYSAEGGSAYLVRPDGYLGYRTDSVSAELVVAYLDRIFAPAP